MEYLKSVEIGREREREGGRESEGVREGGREGDEGIYKLDKERKEVREITGGNKMETDVFIHT